MPMMADQVPITGCSGCATSAGRLGCPTHRPTPPYAPVGSGLIVTTTKVTTRQVPIICEVCRGYGNRPELPDEPDAEWIKCQPCDGKGWLMVTETTIERTA